MNPTSPRKVPITSDADLAVLRQEVREAAKQVGFGLVQQTKLVTAASELARNTLVHGGGGHVELEYPTRGPVAGLRLSFIDDGPGIADIEQAMTDGWSSGNGLGLGLSGARRLTDEFTVDSRRGQGTTVAVTCWARTAVAR